MNEKKPKTTNAIDKLKTFVSNTLKSATSSLAPKPQTKMRAPVMQKPRMSISSTPTASGGRYIKIKNVPKPIMQTVKVVKQGYNQAKKVASDAYKDLQTSGPNEGKVTRFAEATVRTPVKLTKETFDEAKNFVMSKPSTNAVKDYIGFIKKGTGAVASIAGTAGIARKPLQLIASSTIGAAGQVLSNISEGKSAFANLDKGVEKGIETAWILPITNRITDTFVTKIAPGLLTQNIDKGFKLAGQTKGLAGKAPLLIKGIRDNMIRGLLETPAETVGFAAWDNIKSNRPFVESMVDNALPTLLGNQLFFLGKSGVQTGNALTKQAQKEIFDAVKHSFTSPDSQRGSINLEAFTRILRRSGDAPDLSKLKPAEKPPIDTTKIKPFDDFDEAVDIIHGVKGKPELDDFIAANKTLNAEMERQLLPEELAKVRDGKMGIGDAIELIQKRIANEEAGMPTNFTPLPGARYEVAENAKAKLGRELKPVRMTLEDVDTFNKVDTDIRAGVRKDGSEDKLLQAMARKYLGGVEITPANKTAMQVKLREIANLGGLGSNSQQGPQQAFGLLAGLELKRDEDGKVVGVQVDPSKAALGFLVAGGVQNIRGKDLGILFRAVDSTDKKSTLGKGTYFTADSSAAEQFGKEIKEFSIDPNAKLLNLQEPASLSKFADEAVKNNADLFESLTKKGLSDDDAIGQIITKVAKEQGFDGIVADQKSFGTVIFDKAKFTEAPKAAKPTVEEPAMKSIESIIEEKGGWKPGMRQQFDTALFNKDAKTVEALLPQVPLEYKMKFSDDISALVKQPVETGVPSDSIKPRKFLQTVQESATSTEELKKGISEIDPQDYVVQTNKESLSKVDSLFQKGGVDEVRTVFEDAKPSAVKGAAYVKLMDYYQNNQDLDSAVKLTEQYDRELREAGRFVQAASIWNRLTPGGFLRWAEQQVEQASAKYGKIDAVFGKGKVELTLDDKKYILEEMTKIQAMPDGVDKTDATLQIIDYIAKKVPPAASELIDAYRYQNMLSGVKTQERNIYQNMLNTFISRPWEIGTRGGIDWVKSGLSGADREAYVTDVPIYYKNAINAVPNAVEAFKASWNYEQPTGGMGKEAAIEFEDTFQQARSRQLPKSLTIVQRLMEGFDKFNSALIAGGEFAVQKRRGIDDETAMATAERMAQKYLLRTELNAADPDLSYMSKMLVSVGKGAENFRRLPYIGKPFGWMMPFIRTPFNAGVALIERSPLALARPEMNDEALAKIINGTMVTAVGAMFALQGRTTWTAPTNPEQKKWWYATGRKPFSVQVGKTWVPAWYFGPYALALMLPAAAKYYHQDSNGALTDSGAMKLFKMAQASVRFVASQTSVQGLGNFFATIEGDADYTIPSQLGFTAGQTIPFASFIRWINTGLDPVYRKAGGFKDTIKKDLPILSKSVKPILDPLGQPSKRAPINFMLPYDLGRENEVYEAAWPVVDARAKLGSIDNKISAIKQSAEKGEITIDEASKKLIDLVKARLDFIEELQDAEEKVRESTKKDSTQKKPSSDTAKKASTSIVATGGGRKGKKPAYPKTRKLVLKRSRGRTTPIRIVQTKQPRLEDYIASRPKVLKIGTPNV